MEPLKDASDLYEVERRAHHAEPGFRIAELQISPTQTVPWHYHTNIQDTFYVIEGHLRLFLRDPKQEVRLGSGDTYSVRRADRTSLRMAGTARRSSSCSRASVNTITSLSCSVAVCWRESDSNDCPATASSQ